MPRYIRNRQPGGIYFFTAVTYQRRSLFTEQIARDALRNAIEQTREHYPINVVAWVLLPDHLHAIWHLPEDDSDYSTRWRLIKARFTREMNRMGAVHSRLAQSRSRQRHLEQPVWQRRFWEHTIRNDHDLHRHIQYVHYNPVKHQLVDDAAKWPYSTIHRYDYENLTGEMNFDPKLVARMECE